MVENLIGKVEVPLGIAGPLGFNTKQGFRNFYIPLATTEAALVASINRGAKAITESGNANVLTEKIGVTRGPVFKTGSLVESNDLSRWITEHFDDLRRVSSTTSSHLKLLKMEPNIVGNYLFERMYFDTEEAMGMNMATIATQKMVEFIEEKRGVKCISLSGNYCVDKKPSWINFIGGRGFKCDAEVVLSEDVLVKTLKTTAGEFYDTWMAKCMIGSAISGSMGFNAQFANVVSALFLATGQDLAHVVEGSLGITTAEVRGKDLYVSVHLPSLMIGTIGGGTQGETQKKALSIIGINNVEELAEVVSVAVLAGEISLIASLSQGSLARAHQNLRLVEQK
jgi:hydroxymethylglutaryl-CoA reductase (NADPH)